MLLSKLAVITAAVLSLSNAIRRDSSSVSADFLASESVRELKDHVLRQDTSGGSFVFDKCRSSDECNDIGYDFVYCQSVNQGTEGASCDSDYPTCRCLPDFSLSSTFRPCENDFDCISGETCVLYTPGPSGLLSRLLGVNFDFSTAFCASESAERTLSDVEPFPLSGSDPSGNETVIDTTSPFSNTGGLHLDVCRASDECLSTTTRSAECLGTNRGIVGATCRREIPSCRCVNSDYSWTKCSDDDDCIVGEVCVTYTPGSSGPLAQISSYYDDYDFDEPFCASGEAEGNLSDIERYSAVPSNDTTTTGTETVIDTTTPFSETGGLTLDLCREDSDCAQTSRDVECLTLASGNVGEYCTAGSIGCRCFPQYSYATSSDDYFVVCKNNDDCLVGEACARYTGERGELLTKIEELDFTRPFCISVEAAEDLENVELLSGSGSSTSNSTQPGPGEADTGPSSQPTQAPSGGSNPVPSSDETSTPDASAEATGEDDDDLDQVCIDARAIKHLPSEELVFHRHRMARVLCDSNGSCATPGHMVMFRGHGIRMRTYCRISKVKCREDHLYVNSPRYRRGIRIKSNTEGLEFTALAARYETWTEELLLAGALRLGL